jgi:hypothetical protein
MKKNQFVLIAAILVFMASCGTGGSDSKQGTNGETTQLEAQADTAIGSSTDSFSTFIPKDSANKMIQSYLNSIGDSASTSANDSDLRSLIVDMKVLGDYCKQTSSAGFKPVKMKLMFAHTLDFVNSGRGNQNCGYQSGKFTLVVALYDSVGNYVYMNGNSVLDHLQPCPTNCPTSGSAASNLLQ